METRYNTASTQTLSKPGGVSGPWGARQASGTVAMNRSIKELVPFSSPLPSRMVKISN